MKIGVLRRLLILPTVLALAAVLSVSAFCDNAVKAEPGLTGNASLFVQELAALSTEAGEDSEPAFTLLRADSDYPKIQFSSASDALLLQFWKDNVRIYPQSVDAVPDRIQILASGLYADLCENGTKDAWLAMLKPLLTLTYPEPLSEEACEDLAEEILQRSDFGQKGEWLAFDSVRYKLFIYYPDLCDEYCTLYLEAADTGLTFNIDYTVNQ